MTEGSESVDVIREDLTDICSIKNFKNSSQTVLAGTSRFVQRLMRKLKNSKQQLWPVMVLGNHMQFLEILQLVGVLTVS